MAVVATRLHDAQIRDLIRSPVSPVGKDLRKRARRVERLAKRYVGKETGALRESIMTRYGQGLRGPTAHIGSDLRYALLHHRGTRPHLITAPPGKTMSFRSGGAAIFTTSVMHPGTRGNPFLLRALVEGVN